jgi:hypothetical protein
MRNKIIVALLMIICFIFPPTEYSVGRFEKITINKTPSCNQLQIFADHQILNGSRINTRNRNSLIEYGNREANIIVEPYDKIELVGFSIANNGDTDVIIQIQEVSSSFIIKDSGGFEITQPITIPGGSVTGPLNIEFSVPEWKGNGLREVFRIAQIDSTNKQVPDCPGEIIKIKQLEYSVFCGDYSVCEEDSYWTGLSQSGYPAGYPEYDINVSVSEDDESETSDHKRNIAIGGNRIHIVWIETIDNKRRNVYYSYADLPICDGTRWSKPIDVSQFKNQQIQARGVSVAAGEDSVFIVWNVEMNCKDGMPLELDKDDDHSVFCVKGLVGKEGCWYSMEDDGNLMPYDPPVEIGDVKKNNANISHNGEYDSWNPVVAVDSYDRPHISWENMLPFTYKRFQKEIYHCILWVFWEDGWKTITRFDESNTPVPYEFTKKGECNAIIIAKEYQNYKSPSIVIGECRYEGNRPLENVVIGFHNSKDRSLFSYERGFDSVDEWYGSYLNKLGEGENISVGYLEYWMHGCNVYYVFEGYDGNIYSNLYKAKIIETSGKSKNPSIVLCNISEWFRFSFHIVYENDGEIFYFAGCPEEGNIKINISNNLENSTASSIVLDDRYAPHIVWTDETPNNKPEVVYSRLDFKAFHEIVDEEH